jgi:hypothetical protein
MYFAPREECIAVAFFICTRLRNGGELVWRQEGNQVEPLATLAAPGAISVTTSED